MNRNLPVSEFAKMIPAILESEKTVTFCPQGTSMLPTIKQGDAVTFVKPERISKYDIILFLKPEGKAVLHRVIAKEKDGTFTAQGDSRAVKEKNITPENIVAKALFLKRKGKKHKLCGFWFYIKSFIILHLKYFKRAICH